VPHRIDAALIGDPTGQARTVDAVQRVAKGSLVFRQYPSVPTALHAIDEQNVYAALDLTSESPTLYMASAAGASVAHMLEGISAVDPTVRVVDTHPLGTADPNGLVVFYRDDRGLLHSFPSSPERSRPVAGPVGGLRRRPGGRRVVRVAAVRRHCDGASGSGLLRPISMPIQSLSSRRGQRLS